MDDLVQMARDSAAVLAPYAPWLTGVGEAALETLGQKVTETAGEAAGGWVARLWQLLGSSRDLKEVAVGPVTDASTLARAIGVALQQDTALANAVQAHLAAAPTVVISSGTRSVSIGGDANGATVISGDNNQA